MSLFEVQSMIAILNKKSKADKGGGMSDETLDKLMTQHREKYDWIK